MLPPFIWVGMFGSLPQGLGAPMGPTGHVLWGGRPPKPRCHRPVTPQEPHQCLGDDTNLCLGCQVEVKLCHSHHHLRGDTCMSHMWTWGHPRGQLCPPVSHPATAKGNPALGKSTTGGSLKTSPTPWWLLGWWGHHEPRLDTTGGLGDRAGLTAALRLCSRGLVLRRSKRWSGSMT